MKSKVYPTSVKVNIMRTIKIIFVLSCLLSFSVVINSQVPSPGQVIDSVQCKNTPGQSYALFLPVSYDEKNTWPVILIFDPAARGRAGVNAFVDAGRKNGFILACSNNSRNGPMADNFTAAAAMLRDVTERFKADQKRIYASGFSGGSRFAVAFAVTEKRISGVIGCGAGLPGDRNYLPSWNSGFLYYGLAGTRDMNYLEMYDLHDFFNNKSRIISYFRTFSGVHQWPAPELLTEAVEWLIFQSMNRKVLPPDKIFIANIERKTESLINSSLSNGYIIDAVRYMKSAIRDFRGTPFETRMSQLLAETEKSSEYKAAVRRWSKMIADEQESKEKYMNYLGEILNSGAIPDTASGWWKKEILMLNRSRDKGNSENSQMASRLLNFISIACSEQGTSFYNSNYYTQSAFLFEICTLSDSENPNNYYNLARSLAASGRNRKSVEALTAAVNHGFLSRKRVESDPAFSGIRNDAGYRDLLGRMK